MQFGIMEADTFFSLNDPLMALGTVYGFLWLLLAIIFVFSRAKGTGLPGIRLLALFYVFAGLYLIKSVVMAFINIPLPFNISLGMFGGGPPLWISLISLVAGSSLGWFIRRRSLRRGSRSAPSEAQLKEGSEARRGSSRARILSLIFPGLGQIYEGKPVWGLMIFMGLTFASMMVHVYGLVAGYLMIQLDMAMRPSLLDRITGWAQGGKPKN
jgi:hypothetical protein